MDKAESLKQEINNAVLDFIGMVKDLESQLEDSYARVEKLKKDNADLRSEVKYLESQQ